MTLTREQIANMRGSLYELECGKGWAIELVAANLPALLDIAEAVANAPVGTVLAVTAGDDIGDLETTVLSGQSHKNGTRIAMVVLPLAGEVASG